MNIAIGADHRGYALKEELKTIMPDIVWHDYGTDSQETTDYPLYAQRVACAVHKKEVQQGVLLCGTGVGMAIAANRFKGIYAALAWNSEIAQRAKEEDSANILVIPSDYSTAQEAAIMIHAWLTAEPKAGRYKERIKAIDNMFNE